MSRLDKEQVKLIAEEVDKAAITMLQLRQELIDHICCEVELLMKEGKSFDDAHAAIKEQTGIKVLQTIQENTLYLTDKKYALMKTAMKISGNISVALLAIGTILKIFHKPAAGMMLVAGFALLCLLFFPAVIYMNQPDSKRTAGQQIRNLSILTGGIIFMAGILFRVMHWHGADGLLISGGAIILFIFLPVLLLVRLSEPGPTGTKGIFILGVSALMIFGLAIIFKLLNLPGTAVLLVTGCVMLVSIFLPLFAWKRLRETGKISGEFIFLIILSMNATIMITLMAFKKPEQMLGHFVHTESNSALISDYFARKKNQPPNTKPLFSDSLRAGTSLGEVSIQADKLHVLISEIELALIREVEHVDNDVALSLQSSPELIRGKNNVSKVRDIMIGEDGNGYAKTLKQELEAFRKKVAEANSPELNRNYNVLLDTTPALTVDEQPAWEQANFGNNMLISSLALLKLIEKNVRWVESETIRHNQIRNN